MMSLPGFFAYCAPNNCFIFSIMLRDSLLPFLQHEIICSAPSQVFYDNKLQTYITVKRRATLSSTINQFWPSVHPIVVFDVIEKYNISSKKFTGKFDIHSKFNQTEALKVVSLVLLSKHSLLIFITIAGSYTRITY